MKKDSRRFFTPAQRRALYWVNNGCCEECGVKLDPHNWHADHTHPHSKGGATDVINGRALCPDCNLKKGANVKYTYANLYLNTWPSNPPLRRWQERFLERWLLLCDPNAGGQKDFLMAVVPAAGKTTASLKAAHEGLSRGWFGRIVVVVPSLNLVNQWIESAAEKGISLKEIEDYGRGITAPKDFAGIVTTYQTVAANPERFRAYTSRGEPVFVIGDEIHHCGEAENLSWGEGMLRAFNHNGTIRLTSSGTPFRTDNASIPFVEYDDKMIEIDGSKAEIQRVARADFEYSYGEALRDGVVRDIFFPTWDSKLSWRRAGQEYTYTFQDDLDSGLASDRLKAALEPSGEWLPEVIKNAHDRLITIRSEEGHQNAGGLIICKNQEHANSIAKIVEKVTGVTPIIVHSEFKNASNMIDDFKKSTALWIVTVRMVSEGVDIKRLRVGVYATNYKTRLFFQQAIARTTRYDATVPGLARDGEPIGQPAWFYVPDDPDLQAYMAELMEITVHHISEGLDNSDYDLDGTIKNDGQITFLDGYEFINGTDVIETGHFYEEKKWTTEDMDRAVTMAHGIPSLERVPPAAIALLFERWSFRQTPPEPSTPEVWAPTQAPVTKELTQQDQRKLLKKACSSMARRLTYLLLQTNQAPMGSSGKYQVVAAIVNAKLNQQFGIKNIGESTNESLKERRDLLARWISDVVREQWDLSRLE